MFRCLVQALTIDKERLFLKEPFLFSFLRETFREIGRLAGNILSMRHQPVDNMLICFQSFFLVLNWQISSTGFRVSLMLG